VVPLTVTANTGNWDVGVRTAFINSNFNGVLLLDGQKIGTRKIKLFSPKIAPSNQQVICQD
jgi:hypothetical protein